MEKPGADPAPSGKSLERTRGAQPSANKERHINRMIFFAKKPSRFNSPASPDRDEVVGKPATTAHRLLRPGRSAQQGERRIRCNESVTRGGIRWTQEGVGSPGQLGSPLSARSLARGWFATEVSMPSAFVSVLRSDRTPPPHGDSPSDRGTKVPAREGSPFRGQPRPVWRRRLRDRQRGKTSPSPSV
jgi:hypothetical protein